MAEKDEQLIAAIKVVLVDNKLTCAQAHKIAEELQVSLAEVGKKADDLGIKLSKCQLGCF